MSTEQKLREAIKRLLKANRITIQAPPKTITDAENQLREIENAVKYAEEALATTEPEPTGMPEVKPWDHPEPQTMRWSDLEIRWIQSYGKRCWNAGFRHGDFSDENISYLAQIRDAVAEICPGASEGLLMNAIGGPCEVPRYVIDVVQELKQDAERYRCIRRGQHVSVINGIGDMLRAENLDAAIDAAMAQGVKG